MVIDFKIYLIAGLIGVILLGALGFVWQVNKALKLEISQQTVKITEINASMKKYQEQAVINLMAVEEKQAEIDGLKKASQEKIKEVKKNEEYKDWADDLLPVIIIDSLH